MKKFYIFLAAVENLHPHPKINSIMNCPRIDEVWMETKYIPYFFSPQKIVEETPISWFASCLLTGLVNNMPHEIQYSTVSLVE